MASRVPARQPGLVRSRASPYARGEIGAPALTGRTGALAFSDVAAHTPSRYFADAL